MEYMLLIYNDERKWAARPEEERRASMAEYMRLIDDMQTQGVHVAGAPLQPTSASSTVRRRDDELLVVDGPFAETKEQLAGYFLIDVETLEEARAWAARIPTAADGSIEVRPVLALDVEVPA